MMDVSDTFISGLSPHRLHMLIKHYSFCTFSSSSNVCIQHCGYFSLCSGVVSQFTLSSLIHIHIHLVFLHMHARFILIPRNGPMDIASIFICLVIY